MNYAKSYPLETIQEHTNELLKNLPKLKENGGNEITILELIEVERFWKLLEIICLYHDIGKVFTPFQNIIRNKIGMIPLKTRFDYEAVKHEELSPLFIPIEKYQLTEDEKKLVYQVIYYHHERENKLNVNNQLVQEIIVEDILPRLKEIEEEIGIELEKNPNPFYLMYIGMGASGRIKEGDPLYQKYCLLKGFLHKLDHSSSAHIEVEEKSDIRVSDLTEDFMKNQNYKLNDLQQYGKQNQEKNLVVIGSTGMGKTEASLLWSHQNKTFFTLPIRTSINAIYDRISKNIGFESVGLLHSTALDYLEEKQEFENEEQIYEQTKNLSKKITTCTIDQIFPFVFKYRGYEKIYATLSYSKLIIDEIQAYSPEIVAIILKGLEMIHKLGGKFMVMTATLPQIYLEKLQEMKIPFEYGEFIKPMHRHKIKMQENEIVEDINKIKEKGKNHKVLVITNTIAKSIELYLELKEKGVKNVYLLHSRFILKDRSEKENKIKNFSRNREEKGIWITTQMVEASLDIDFDYLYTEMSTLDSLFQRLGRCYRSREYEKEEPNVLIYTKNVSGIQYVYDKKINEKSVELLKKYNNQMLEEQVKVDLVKKLYSQQALENTDFHTRFKEAMKILNNIMDYETSKKEAQKLLRNIENETVIPKVIYDKNIELFQKYKEADKNKDYQQKSKIRREINKLTTTISKAQQWKIKNYLYDNPYMKEDIKIADLKYDENTGLLLEENDIEDRIL